MKIRTAAVVLLLAPVAFAQSTTQPTDQAKVSAAMELRASQAFNEGKYQTALPLLQMEAAGIAKQNDPMQADKLAMVQEQIRVCQKNGAKAGSFDGSAAVTPTAAAAPAAVTDPSTDPGPNREKHPAPVAGKVLDLQIKQLGNFSFDPDKGGDIPDDVKRLSGTMIRLHGFMIPMDQAENISQFALVPSLFACCYGQPPQIQHTIVVNCPKGKAVSYYPDEIVVTGKLDVKEKKDDGFIVSIFDVETSSVKPASK